MTEVYPSSDKSENLFTAYDWDYSTRTKGYMVTYKRTVHKRAYCIFEGGGALVRYSSPKTTAIPSLPS